MAITQQKNNFPPVDFDLANFNHLVSTDTPGGKAFAEYAAALAQKLTASLAPEENPLNECRVAFYLQDRADSSPARISSCSWRTDPTDLSGTDFVVMFNKEKLAMLKTEDELAFILGHELSHLGWQHGNEKIRALACNEEAACDANAMKMMYAAGFDVNVVCSMDEKAPLTEEWRERKELRRRQAAEYFSFRRPQALDGSVWQRASHTPWKHGFKAPAVDCPEAEAVAMMIKDLHRVYAKGGEEEFSQMLEQYVETKAGAEGSRFFLRLAAAATKDFPPIDEVKKQKGYRQMQRHPINVLGNIIPAVASMPGKKLFPPEAVATINVYMRDNPDYGRPMSCFWKKVLPSAAPVNGKCQRSRQIYLSAEKFQNPLVSRKILLYRQRH